ncbi:hypothetical protein Tco_1191522 [Tanacetum coccineum]
MPQKKHISRTVEPQSLPACNYPAGTMISFLQDPCPTISRKHHDGMVGVEGGDLVWLGEGMVEYKWGFLRCFRFNGLQLQQEELRDPSKNTECEQNKLNMLTCWTLKHVRSFSDDQLKVEFDKIRHALANLQSQHLRRASGPRTRSQSSAADIKKYSTRRKSLATRKMPSSEVDLNAPDTSFIKVLSDDHSDDSDDDTNPLFWHAFAAWEVIPTGLGDVNALYFTDKSSKYFTHLREILHLIDRQDLSKLYGMVVKHYEVNPLAGTGMILWGDLHVLFESTTGGSSVEVWNDQQEWVIHSWKLFPFSGVHVLETFTGKILYMFADTPYPLSASLMKKMLKHKLEVEIDGIGNDMTYAVQLIQFIKNQLASCVPSA